MVCFVELENKDYKITISFKRLCELLELDVTPELIDKAIERAVRES